MKARRQSLAYASVWIVFSSLIVALLVPIQSARAELIIRAVNVTLNTQNPAAFNLDLDLNGIPDFTFVTAFDPSLPNGFAAVNTPLGTNNGVVIDMATLNGFPTASFLGAGDIVSAASLFSNAGFDQANLCALIGGSKSGNFCGETGIVGLRFDGAGGILFGFAEVTVNDVDAAVNPLGLTIGDVGFNNVVLQQIVIPNVIPEPGSLALLALAGFGLLVLRRPQHHRMRELMRSPALV